jgi:XTP/dITP diphosphohydrolase
MTVMVRNLGSGTLIIATHNPGKVREITDLVAPFGVETTSAAQLGLPEPEETGDTFAENARIKARAAAAAGGHPALADDSGLVVPSLGGAPGVLSARWAGPQRDFGLAMERLNEALTAASAERLAYFACALAIGWPDGHVETVEGYVHGHLVWPPRGEQGFGYDPVFVADGDTRTFGELDPAEKHRISHRADAFRKLVRLCFDGS